jgi:hypothetical protein
MHQQSPRAISWAHDSSESIGSTRQFTSYDTWSKGVLRRVWTTVRTHQSVQPPARTHKPRCGGKRERVTNSYESQIALKIPERASKRMESLSSRRLDRDGEAVSALQVRAQLYSSHHPSETAETVLSESYKRFSEDRESYKPLSTQLTDESTVQPSQTRIIPIGGPRTLRPAASTTAGGPGALALVGCASTIRRTSNPPHCPLPLHTFSRTFFTSGSERASVGCALHPQHGETHAPHRAERNTYLT